MKKRKNCNRAVPFRFCIQVGKEEKPGSESSGRKKRIQFLGTKRTQTFQGIRELSGFAELTLKIYLRIKEGIYRKGGKGESFLLPK